MKKVYKNSILKTYVSEAPEITDKHYVDYDPLSGAGDVHRLAKKCWHMVKIKGKGLGRGDDALFIDDLDTIDALEQVRFRFKFNRLPFQKIRPNPYQPRKEFDEEGLAELTNRFVKMESSTNHRS